MVPPSIEAWPHKSSNVFRGAPGHAPGQGLARGPREQACLRQASSPPADKHRKNRCVRGFMHQRGYPPPCFLEVLILGDFECKFSEVLILGELNSFAMSAMRNVQKFLEVLILKGLSPT